MPLRRNAVSDARLVARVTTRTSLHYRAGADPTLDRPDHVRAASGVALIHGRLAIIQDDANFIALIDPWSGDVDSIPLPSGVGDKRQFDDRRGNKRYKLDLEACVAIPGAGGPRLVAFGSGSSTWREQIVLVDDILGREPSVTVVQASRFYESVRQERAFSGSDLNIEGAVYRDGRLTLFGRGNGAPADDRLPLNATCVFDWPVLERHLVSPNDVPPPVAREVTQYELGALDGIPLGFTDAASCREGVLFAAAAEDSPDARRDGRVAGSVLGLISAAGEVRHGRIVATDGAALRAKVEGIAITEDPPRLYGLIDQDDPATPSQLCIIELDGEWPIRCAGPQTITRG